MNSLEYITAEIEWLIPTIKRFEERIAKYNNNNLNKEDLAEVENLNNWLEQYKEKLQILYQIKTDLAAWEVVQKTIVEGQDGDGHYCYIETVYFTGEEGEIVTKGLHNDETR